MLSKVVFIINGKFSLPLAAGYHNRWTLSSTVLVRGEYLWTSALSNNETNMQWYDNIIIHQDFVYYLP